MKRLNEDYAAELSGESYQVDAVIDAYELGFRMQSELPSVMDVSTETQETLELIRHWRWKAVG